MPLVAGQHTRHRRILSMSISREEVEHIALLARMRLTEEEIATMTTQLSAILEHIGVLQEVDVSGIAPSVTLLPQSGVMRDDKTAPSFPVDEMLANAPEREDDYLRVKAVLD